MILAVSTVWLIERHLFLNKSLQPAAWIHVVLCWSVCWTKCMWKRTNGSRSHIRIVNLHVVVCVEVTEWRSSLSCDSHILSTGVRVGAWGQRICIWKNSSTPVGGREMNEWNLSGRQQKMSIKMKHSHNFISSSKQRPTTSKVPLIRIPEDYSVPRHNADNTEELLWMKLKRAARSQSSSRATVTVLSILKLIKSLCFETSFDRNFEYVCCIEILLFLAQKNVAYALQLCFLSSNTKWNVPELCINFRIPFYVNEKYDWRIPAKQWQLRYLLPTKRVAKQSSSFQWRTDSVLRSNGSWIGRFYSFYL